MTSRLVFAMVAAGSTAALPLAASPSLHAQDTKPFMDSAQVNARELTTTGKNSYFVLEPGFELTLANKSGKAQLVITVLAETKEVGGVETRVIEERETEDGLPVEDSRNYFAIHPQTHDVYYFGEDVDTYKKGRITGHEGAWHHGSADARFGLMMPGSPVLGMRYEQEQAPGIARDRAEIVSLTDRIKTPAGTFDQCLTTRETSALEPLLHEYKSYAPGIGLVQDGSLLLLSRGNASSLQK
jgi:hypothetical protein